MKKKVICPVCGTQFERYQSQLKKSSCCSKKCLAVSKKGQKPNNNFTKHSDATKLKLRQMRQKYFIKPNDTFNKITVVEACENKGGEQLWLCRCECGKTVEWPANVLVKRKSCGCEYRKRSTVGLINGTYFGQILHRARKSNIEFQLTQEYLDKLYSEQNGKCALTGIDISIRKGKFDKEATASLDRIDSNLGYVEGNVQFIHKHVNMMKSNHSEEYFLWMCKKIIDYTSQSNSQGQEAVPYVVDGNKET